MAEVANATPSPQNANVFAQTSQKGNEQPDGKKKRGKKGEGNQNKQKPTNNADGGKKEKNKVKFSCKLCHEDHPYLSPYGTSSEAAKSSTIGYPEGSFPPMSEFCFNFKCSRGTPNAPDPSYINMVRS